jgi:hypothetical protein
MASRRYSKDTLASFRSGSYPATQISRNPALAVYQSYSQVSSTQSRRKHSGFSFSAPPLLVFGLGLGLSFTGKTGIENVLKIVHSTGYSSSQRIILP